MSHPPIPPLTPADLAVFADPSTYWGGPTFDLAWEVASRDDTPHLRRAILDDPTISPFDSAPHGSDLVRVIWRPQSHPPLLITISELTCGPAEIFASAYPDHLNHALGIDWRDGDPERLPATRPLFAAGIALARRIHRHVPLLRAAVTGRGRR